jgi:hypothetical protein
MKDTIDQRNLPQEKIDINLIDVHGGNNNQSEFCIDGFDDKCEEHFRIDRIVFIKLNGWKIFLYVILNILTMFIINLFIIWFPKLRLNLLYTTSTYTDSDLIVIYCRGIFIYYIR